MRPRTVVKRWRAPGRVNIIGEHIDYLGGTVLPFACDLEIVCEVEPHPDEVFLTSADEATEVHVPIHTDIPAPDGWGRHVWGVVRALRSAGADLHGLRGRLTSTIPSGAGLSSSTALEVVVALAVTGGDRPEPELLQRAEQEATGVPCGVMDQAALLRAKQGHALLLDCATGAMEHVPLPSSVGFVVVDTGTRRSLSDGRYAQRRAETEAGHPGRVRHAESEQRRVFDSVEALRAGDVGRLGDIISASHASLRDDFEVSSPALDAAVEVATKHHACSGARLVGAGFAGCVLAVTEGGAETEVAFFVEQHLPGSSAWHVHAVDAAGEASS